MGTGASAAKRKAKKAAAAQYYKEFAKLKSVPEMERMSTRNSRELEDSIGDNASGQTKSITRKIDRMSREINKDDDYKKNVKSYNDRYEILQNQISNKDTVRYSTSRKPSELPKTPNGLLNFGGVSNTNKSAGSTMINSFANTGSFANSEPKGKYSLSQSDNSPLYKTKEEAMAEAQKHMEEYNAGLKDMYMKMEAPKNQFGGIGISMDKSPQAAERYAQQNQVTDPNRFIQENKFQKFGVLYRNLGNAEDAVKDVEDLGKKVMNTKTNQLLPEYEKLNERLKGMVKRDARNVQPGNQNQSMVSNELASGKPYTETL